MKKQIKNAILAVLTLATVVTCLPTTTFAKEQFKWSKSLTLEGKAYTDAGTPGHFGFSVYVDRPTDVKVENYKGTIQAYSDSLKNEKPALEYFCKYDDWHVVSDTGMVVSAKNKKEGKTYTIHLGAGFNQIVTIPCTDVKLKDGTKYKCKITSKDANLILLSGKRQVDSKGVGHMIRPSKKTYNAFAKWYKPQDESLYMWLDTGGCVVSDRVAYYMCSGGFTNKTEEAQSKAIQKYVENAVQKSKLKTRKIISYEDAMYQYINSVDGFKEWLQENSREDETYWDRLVDTIDGYLVYQG